IKNVFSAWKNILNRTQVSNVAQLKSVVSNTFFTVNRENCETFFMKLPCNIRKSKNEEITSAEKRYDRFGTVQIEKNDPIPLLFLYTDINGTSLL
ncbi:MAG: hypothetical protein MHPSP_004058, partial [Paramarteilia canceri]